MSSVMFYMENQNGNHELFFYKNMVKKDTTIRYVNDVDSLNLEHDSTVMPFTPLDSQKERLRFINNVNIKETYTFNKHWLDLNTFIASGFFVPNSEFSNVFKLDDYQGSPSREIFINTIKDIVKELRKQEVLKGVKYKGALLALDLHTVSSLLRSVDVLDIFPLDFKTETGSFILIRTEDELLEVNKVIHLGLQKCFSAEKETVSEISVMSDMDLYKLYSAYSYNNDISKIQSIFNKHMEA